METGDQQLEQTTEPLAPRRQAEAHRVAQAKYPFQRCVVCGLQVPTCLTVAHLDHVPGSNDPDNLAFPCHTNH